MTTATNLAVDRAIAMCALTRRRLLTSALCATATAATTGCGGGSDGGGGNDGAGGNGAFTSVASMRTPRQFASAARLPGGRVLIAGGNAGGPALASTEIFDPATGRWSDAASMRVARSSFGNDGFLVPLASGRVLALGSTAELYDSASDTWTLLPAPPVPMASSTKTLLADGRLLVIPNQSSQVYLYDPASGLWTSVGGFDRRSDHAATALADGRVLISGGRASVKLATALLFDPQSRTWRSAGTLRNARYSHFSFALPDGRVAVSHGIVDGGTLADTTEVYDPASGAWRSAGNIRKFSPSTVGASGTPLSGGRFLVAGGGLPGNGGAIVDQVPQGQLDETNGEWFDPATLTWQRATQAPGGLVVPRLHHAAVALADGSVLIAGGMRSTLSTSATAAAEIYRG